jgi:hypothetical protein
LNNGSGTLGTVTTAQNNTGTLKVKTDATISNTIGALGGQLAAVVLEDSGTLTLAASKNIFAPIVAATAGKGTLNFLGAASTNFNIGDGTKNLKTINFATGATTNVNHDLFAQTITGGDLVVNGNINAGDISANSLNFTSDKTITLSADQSAPVTWGLSSSNATSSAPLGSLLVLGSGTFSGSGDLGSSSKKLKIVSAGENNKTVVFSKAIHTQGNGGI